MTDSLPNGYQNLTISSGVRASAIRTPKKVALIVGEHELSYANLVARINQVANAAAEDLKLREGDNAAILAPNSREYVEIVCGVADAGAAVATPSPRLTSREIADICNDSEAKVLFLHPSCEDTVDLSSFDTVRRVIRIGAEYERWVSKSASHFVDRKIPEWAPFSLPYTSGTTGRPKGVMVSHRSRVLGFHMSAVEFGMVGPDDHFYAVAPLCHGAGFAMAMGAVFMGGTCEIAEQFDPEVCLRTLNAGSASGVFFVPTHFHKIFELSQTTLNAYRRHNLKGILSNAAALPQATKEKVIEYFGDGLLNELYGSTEAGYVSNLRPKDQLRKNQCVGQAFPNTTIRLVNEDGADVAIGEVGELYSKSPMLFNGYWNQPEATSAAFRGSWLTVGDLARMDDEGYLYIVGRKSDMVVTGGINVYPREVEEVLARNDAVVEAAVIGVPDEKFGETLVGFVVCRDKEHITSEELSSFCRADLASYKVPKEFHFIAELPRNVAGKVTKHELAANYASTAKDAK